MKLKVGLVIGLELLLGGCANSNNSNLHMLTSQPLTHVVKKAQSYELSDLCDTEVKERELYLRVYISPSEQLWDYHEYREELFGYVIGFFSSQHVKCVVQYSNKALPPLISPNTVGIEIYDLATLERRLSELSDKPKNFNNDKGIAISEAGIALINGTWEEFRTILSKEEVKEQFSSFYFGIPVQKYILRQNAQNICHEVLHCLGLWHVPNGEYVAANIPNVMSYDLPKFIDELPIGSTLTSVQRRIIHSHLASNNAFTALTASNCDFETYVSNIFNANPDLKY